MAQIPRIPQSFIDKYESVFDVEISEDDEATAPVAAPVVPEELPEEYEQVDPTAPMSLYERFPFLDDRTSGIITPELEVMAPLQVQENERVIAEPTVYNSPQNIQIQKAMLDKRRKKEAFQQSLGEPKSLVSSAFGFGVQTLFRGLNAPSATLIAVFNTLADEDDDGFFNEWWSAVRDMKSLGGQLFGTQADKNDPLYGLLDFDPQHWATQGLEFIASLAIDIVTDPLFYLGGIGAATKVTTKMGGEAFEKLGREVAEGSTRSTIRGMGRESLQKIMPHADEVTGTGASRLRRRAIKRLPDDEVQFTLNNKGEKLRRNLLGEGQTVQQANEVVANMIKDGRIDLLFGGGMRFRLPGIGWKNDAPTWARTDLLFQSRGMNQVGKVQETIAAAEKHFLSGGSMPLNAWHFSMQYKDLAWTGLAKPFKGMIQKFHKRGYDKSLERYTEKDLVQAWGLDKSKKGLGRFINKINLSSLSISRRKGEEAWDAAVKMKENITFEWSGSAIVWNNETRNSIKRLSEKIVHDGHNKVLREGVEVSLSKDEVYESIVNQIYELSHVNIDKNELGNVLFNLKTSKANLNRIEAAQRQFVDVKKIADPSLDSGDKILSSLKEDAKTKSEDAWLSMLKAESVKESMDDLLNEAHIAEVLSDETRRELDDLTNLWNDLQKRQSDTQEEVGGLIDMMDGQYGKHTGLEIPKKRADQTIGSDWMIAQMLQDNDSLSGMVIDPLYQAELKRGGGQLAEGAESLEPSTLFSATGDLLGSIFERVQLVQEQLQQGHQPLRAIFQDKSRIPKAFSDDYISDISVWFGKDKLRTPSDFKTGVAGMDRLPRMSEPQLALSLLKDVSAVDINRSLKDGKFNVLVDNALVSTIPNSDIKNILEEVYEEAGADTASLIEELGDATKLFGEDIPAGVAGKFDELLTLTTYDDRNRIKSWVKENYGAAEYLSTYTDELAAFPENESLLQLVRNPDYREAAPRLHELLEGYNKIDKMFSSSGPYGHLVDTGTLMETNVLTALGLYEEKSARYIGNKTYINELMERYGKPASDVDADAIETQLSNGFLGVGGGGLGLSEEMEQAREEGRPIDWTDPKIAINFLLAGWGGIKIVGDTAVVQLGRSLQHQDWADILIKHNDLASSGTGRIFETKGYNSLNKIPKRYRERIPLKAAIVNFSSGIYSGFNPAKLVNQETGETVDDTIYNKILGWDQYNSSVYQEIASKQAYTQTALYTDNPAHNFIVNLMLSPNESEIPYNLVRKQAEQMISPNLKGMARYSAIEDIVSELNLKIRGQVKGAQGIAEVYGKPYSEFVEMVEANPEIKQAYSRIGGQALRDINENVLSVTGETVKQNNVLLKYMYDNLVPEDIKFGGKERATERLIWATHLIQMINDKPDSMRKSFFGNNIPFLKNLARLSGMVWDEPMMYDGIVNAYDKAIRSDPKMWAKTRAMTLKAGRNIGEYDNTVRINFLQTAGGQDTIFGSENLVVRDAPVPQNISQSGVSLAGKVSLAGEESEEAFTHALQLEESELRDPAGMGDVIQDVPEGQDLETVTQQELALDIQSQKRLEVTDLQTKEATRIQNRHAGVGQGLELTDEVEDKLVVKNELNGNNLSIQHVFGDVIEKNRMKLTDGPVLVNKASKIVEDMMPMMREVKDLLDNDVIGQHLTQDSPYRTLLRDHLKTLINNSKFNELYTGLVEGHDLLDLYRDDPDGLPIEMVRLIGELKERGLFEDITSLAKGAPGKVFLPYLMEWDILNETMLNRLFGGHAEFTSPDPNLGGRVEYAQQMSDADIELERQNIMDSMGRLKTLVIGNPDQGEKGLIELSRMLDAHLNGMAEIGTPVKSHIEGVQDHRTQRHLLNGWNAKVDDVYGVGTSASADADIRVDRQQQYKEGQEARALEDAVLGIEIDPVSNTTLMGFDDQSKLRHATRDRLNDKALRSKLEGTHEQVHLAPLRNMLEVFNDQIVTGTPLWNEHKDIINSFIDDFETEFPDKNMDGLDLVQMLSHFTTKGMDPSKFRALVYEYMMRDPVFRAGEGASGGVFTDYVHTAISNLKEKSSVYFQPNKEGLIDEYITDELDALSSKTLVSYKHIENLGPKDSQLLVDGIKDVIEAEYAIKVSQGLAEADEIGTAFSSEEFDRVVNWFEDKMSGSKFNKNVVASLYQMLAGKGNALLKGKLKSETSAPLMKRLWESYGELESVARDHKINIHPFDLMDMLFALQRSGEGEITAAAIKELFSNNAGGELNQRIRDAANKIQHFYNKNQAMDSLPELWAFRNIMAMTDKKFFGPFKMRASLANIHNSYRIEAAEIERRWHRPEVTESGRHMPDDVKKEVARLKAKDGDLEHYVSDSDLERWMGSAELAKIHSREQVRDQLKNLVGDGSNHAVALMAAQEKIPMAGMFPREGSHSRANQYVGSQEYLSHVADNKNPFTTPSGKGMLTVDGAELAPLENLIFIPMAHRDFQPLDLSLALTDQAIAWFSHEPVSLNLQSGRNLLVRTLEYMKDLTETEGLSPFVSLVDMRKILTAVNAYREGSLTGRLSRRTSRELSVGGDPAGPNPIINNRLAEGIYKHLTSGELKAYQTISPQSVQRPYKTAAEQRVHHPVRQDTYTAADIQNAIRLLDTIGTDNPVPDVKKMTSKSKEESMILDATDLPIHMMTHQDLANLATLYNRAGDAGAVGPTGQPIQHQLSGLFRTSGIYRSRNELPELQHPESVDSSHELASEKKLMLESNVGRSDGVLVLVSKEDYHPAIAEAGRQGKNLMVAHLDDLGITFKRDVSADKYGREVPIKVDYEFDSTQFHKGIRKLQKWVGQYGVQSLYPTGLSEYHDPGITDVMRSVLHHMFIGEGPVPRVDLAHTISANGFEVSNYSDGTKLSHYDPENRDKVLGNPNLSIDRIPLHYEEAKAAISPSGEFVAEAADLAEENAGNAKTEMPISEFFHMTVKGWGDVFNWKHLTRGEQVSPTLALQRERGGSSHGQDKHLEWFKSDSSYSGVMNMVNHCETCLLTGAEFNVNPDTGMIWNSDELNKQFGMSREQWGQIVSNNPNIFINRQWPEPIQKVLDDSKINLDEAYSSIEWDRDPQIDPSKFRVRMLSSGKDVAGNDMFTSLHSKNLFMELQGWLQGKFKDTLDFAFEQEPVYLKDAATGKIEYLSGYMPVGMKIDEATGEVPLGSIRDSIYRGHMDSEGFDITEQYRISAQNKLNERCGSADAICYWFNKHLNNTTSPGMTTQELLGTPKQHQFHLPNVPLETRTWYNGAGAIQKTAALPLKKLLGVYVSEEGKLLSQIDRAFKGSRESMAGANGAWEITNEKERELAYKEDIETALHLLATHGHGEGAKAIQARTLEYLKDIGGPDTFRKTIKIMTERVNTPVTQYEGNKLVTPPTTVISKRIRDESGNIVDIRPHAQLLKNADAGVQKEFAVAIKNWKNQTLAERKVTIDNLVRRYGHQMLSTQKQIGDIEQADEFDPSQVETLIRLGEDPPHIPAYDVEKNVREYIEGRSKGSMSKSDSERLVEAQAKLSESREDLRKAVTAQQEGVKEAGTASETFERLTRQATEVSDIPKLLLNQGYVGMVHRVSSPYTVAEREELASQLVSMEKVLSEDVRPLTESVRKNGIRIYDKGEEGNYNKSVAVYSNKPIKGTQDLVEKEGLASKKVEAIDIEHNPDLRDWYYDLLEERVDNPDMQLRLMKASNAEIDAYLEGEYHKVIDSLKEYLFFKAGEYPVDIPIEKTVDVINTELGRSVNNVQKSVDDVLTKHGYNMTEERLEVNPTISAHGRSAAENLIRFIAEYPQDTLPDGMYNEIVHDVAIPLATEHGISSKVYSSTIEERDRVIRQVEIARRDKKYELMDTEQRKQAEGTNIINDTLAGLIRMSLSKNPEFLQALAKAANPGEPVAVINKFKKDFVDQLNHPRTGNAYALAVSNNEKTRRIFSEVKPASGDKFPFAHVMLKNFLKKEGREFVEEVVPNGKAILNGTAPITEGLFKDIITSYKETDTGVVSTVRSVIDLMDPEELKLLDVKQKRGGNPEDYRGEAPNTGYSRMPTKDLAESTTALKGSPATPVEELVRRLGDLASGKAVRKESSVSAEHQDLLRSLGESPSQQYVAGASQIAANGLLEDNYFDQMTDTLLPLGEEKKMLKLLGDGNTEYLKHILQKDMGSVRRLIKLAFSPMNTDPSALEAAAYTTVEKLLREEFKPITRGYVEYFADSRHLPMFQGETGIRLDEIVKLIFKTNPKRTGQVLMNKVSDLLAGRSEDEGKRWASFGDSFERIYEGLMDESDLSLEVGSELDRIAKYVMSVIEAEGL